jgi:eukaryotic-like serine/threonine-protein kinase
VSKSPWLVLNSGILLAVFLTACGRPPAGAISVSPRDQMKLVYVPAGRFDMGQANHKDEIPVHAVDLKAFWIDQTEVTNSKYMQCVVQGRCRAPRRTNSYARESYYGNPEFANHPVIYVDWSDAQAYCGWSGRRLPTEAEWEKAARGTDGRIYPWGNEVARQGLLNFYFYVGDTAAVGSYPSGASPYGALDMAGNVWEWVADWYGSDYYAGSPASDPTGPASGTARVVRGGAWLDHEFSVQSAQRFWYGPDSAFFNVGFRCAMDAP